MNLKWCLSSSFSFNSRQCFNHRFAKQKTTQKNNALLYWLYIYSSVKQKPSKKTQKKKYFYIMKRCIEHIFWYFTIFLTGTAQTVSLSVYFDLNRWVHLIQKGGWKTICELRWKKCKAWEVVQEHPTQPGVWEPDQVLSQIIFIFNLA